MGNLGFKLKKFFQNKNTVTILGVILITAILYFGYNWRIKQVTNPVSVPYAKVTIQPKTKITEDMIGYVDVLPNMVKSSVITNAKNIIGYYVNYNSMIPEGSLFYKSAVVSVSNLPDSVLSEVPDGYILFNMSVTSKTTYGNSIFPGNYIDLYVKVLNEDGNPAIGKLLENVKVLAVKDSAGNNVFEKSDETRTPALVLFAVPKDIYPLLKTVTYLSSYKAVAAEFIPVPTAASFNAEPGELRLASSELKAYLELYAGNISEDNLPDFYDYTEDYTEENNENIEVVE